MKKIMQNLTRRQILLGISGLLSFLVFLLLTGVNGYMAGKQDSQTMAGRWASDGGAAQVSCFFSQKSEVTEETILFFEHALDQALVAASITQDSPNASARLWTDAYSASGSLTIASNKTSLKLDAVGIGGDFFAFHPMKLKSGTYFSGNDLMKDLILIDEDTAWQLFGSNDVAGQFVTISGVPHIIAGVVEREQGRLAEAAGLDSPIAYVSFETLSKFANVTSIAQYEIAMPNPVSGYAEKYIRENIGVDEKEVEVIENSARYDLFSLIEIMAGFGTRSMNGKAIIYPYWENIARGYEDILVGILFLQALFLLYAVILLIIAIVKAWKRRTWTVRSVYLTVKDKWERLLEKKRAIRQSGKKEKIKPDRAHAKKPVRRNRTNLKQGKNEEMKKYEEME